MPYKDDEVSSVLDCVRVALRRNLGTSAKVHSLFTLLVAFACCLNKSQGIKQSNFRKMEGQYIIQQTGREEEEDEAPREGELREQDRFLPIYNISKVMKKVVPHSGKVAKEARECVQECVSEFISFITRLVM